MDTEEDWKRAFFAALSGTAAVGQIGEAEGVASQLSQDTEPRRIVDKAVAIAGLAVAELVRREEQHKKSEREGRIADLVRRAEETLSNGGEMPVGDLDPTKEIIEALSAKGIQAVVETHPLFGERRLTRKKQS